MPLATEREIEKLFEEGKSMEEVMAYLDRIEDEAERKRRKRKGEDDVPMEYNPFLGSLVYRG